MPDGLKNGKVIELARNESRVLITHDKDFGDTRVYPPENHPGIIILRIHPPGLPKTITGLEALLKSFSPGGFDHKLILLDEKGYQQV